MKTACIILANGFEDLEAIGTIAILRRAGISLRVFGLSDLPKGKYGVSVADVSTMDELHPEEYDLMVLPGGPGYELLNSHPKVIALLEQFHHENKYIAAICAAPTILGKLGMLKGRTYTCFPGMEEESFLGNYVQDKAVVDGTIITGKSAGAVTDFALKIIAELLGESKAEQVRDSIYY